MIVYVAFEDVTSFKDSLDKVIDLFKSASGASSTLPFCPNRPRDCHDVKLAGSLRSGRYVVFPDEDFDPFYVFCDMDTDGGGWTIPDEMVFQRREDGSTNFFRTWIEYHYGFGQLSGEHWLGNSKLHRLTSQRSYELRVDLEDFEGEKSYASYDHFAVEDERDGYRLSLRGFNGTAEMRPIGLTILM
nr:fibrinogen C domain-containing protein 1-like [Lytechinus pictus]